MQLNIKSDEAYRLATTLSELTGESLTAAVIGALRERLEAEQRRVNLDAKKARIVALATELKAELDKAGGVPMTSNHNWLYDDDTGMPV